MNNNSWFKKEKPMLTLPGLGGGSASNLYWSTGDGPSYTYVDDVFSMFLYKGTGSAQTINNGIKLSNADAGNSVDFNGSSDYLSIVDSTDWDLSGVDFTVECWYYPRTNPSWVGLVGQWPVSGVNTLNSWLLEPVGSTMTFHFQRTNSSYGNVSAPGTLQTNQWQHVAAVCKNGDIKVFLNGSGSSWTSTSGTLQNTTSDLTIGGNVAPNYGSGWADGLISNVRITKGQCLYENNFTPSTEPLTTTSQNAIESNVKLLCCNSSIITSGTVTPNTIAIGGGTPKASYGPFTASDGEGGMVWIKSRTSSQYHSIIDTERGPTKAIFSNHTMGQDTGTNGYMSSFHNNGFTTGNYGNTAQSNQDFISWTWRKAPGFFDVVAYTGDGSASRQISHSLGSIPGMVIVKNIDAGYNWTVWHKSEPTKAAQLNQDAAFGPTTDYFGNSSGPITPTSTYFTVNGNTVQNQSGTQYIAYVYAGGQSTESTAKSTDFDGSSETLYVNDSSAFNMGTSDYTVECWIKLDGGSGSLNQHSCLWTMDNYQTSGEVFVLSSGRIGLYSHTGYLMQSPSSGGTIKSNQWHHIAVSRSSGTVQLFVDGVSMGSASQNSITANSFYVGCERNSGGGTGSFVDGKISNLRVVKGTALYTSSFRPPTKVLTNITNTVLLCCNASTAVGASVSPGSISYTGTPTGEVDSPFDDPDGFKFGSSQEGVIKCDSFIVPTGGQLDIELGWEPQWWLWKKSSSSGGWGVYDAMRGVTTGSNDYYLELHNTNTENNVDVLTFNPTGVRINLTSHVGSEFVFMAVRRPDGYVGKPPTLGADVFAMDTGAGRTTIPNFDSGFPVDYTFMKKPASSSSWYTYSRLTQGSELELNGTGSQGGSSAYTFDSNLGWGEGGDSSDWQSWMFKRHAGFDVVAYKGNGGNLSVPHSLGGVVEMIWAKERTNAGTEWKVFHKDIGPTNILRLNNNLAEETNQDQYQSTTPTATHFFVKSSLSTSNSDYLAMLFKSVDGISKVGSYNGSNSPQTITTGFRPRFFWCKRYNGNGNWTVFDTLRGWGSGNDSKFEFNTTGATNSNSDFGYPTATGIYLTVDGDVNSNGYNFIYYAHA